MRKKEEKYPRGVQVCCCTGTGNKTTGNEKKKTNNSQFLFLFGILPDFRLSLRLLVTSARQLLLIQ
jgi:hypothetical protein